MTTLLNALPHLSIDLTYNDEDVIDLVEDQEEEEHRPTSPSYPPSSPPYSDEHIEDVPSTPCSEDIEEDEEHRPTSPSYPPSSPPYSDEHIEDVQEPTRDAEYRRWEGVAENLGRLRVTSRRSLRSTSIRQHVNSMKFFDGLVEEVVDSRAQKRSKSAE